MNRWLLSIAVIVLLSGCGMNNEANRTNDQERTVNVKNSTVQNVDRYTGQQISRHLVELATSRPNVNDATAVVLGGYAIVGIDVNEDIDRAQVGTIKYSVAESLKKDPHGARAIVIADPDVNARLKELQEDIENGKPVQGVMNELAEIAGRLMPEVPADIIDSNPKKTLEDPKKKLDDNESRKLEKQQEKQSNHHKDNQNEQKQRQLLVRMFKRGIQNDE